MSKAIRQLDVRHEDKNKYEYRIASRYDTQTGFIDTVLDGKKHITNTTSNKNTRIKK